MKLKELNEAIASACNVRANIVSAVQAETFRQIRTAMDKGEKIIIPEFGIFMLKDVEAEGGAPAKKIVRFRDKSGVDNAEKEKNKAARKEKRAAEKPKDAGNDDDDE